MAFTLIIGPMKSGKSLELIARVAPYEFAGKKVLYLQPQKNVRDNGVMSRAGLEVAARKVNNLSEEQNGFDVIGVDEVNMFEAEDTFKTVRKWLADGKEVVISGLDLDYSTRLIPVIAKLLTLKPDVILVKKSVCEVCKSYEAIFTQILHNNQPVTSGLPSIVPEDGTYVYQPRCRTCFKSAIL